jgi:DNA segregation ATPase FtsK/SpoIIIE, S-DNA-T family
MTTKKKTSDRKGGRRPFWGALFGVLLAALTAAGIFLAAENENWYGFGIGGLLWALIPLVCAVRLAVRTSRLSIIKTTVICLTGVLVIGAWTCISTQLLTGEPSAKWSGTLGLKAGGWLLEKAGGTAEGYFIATAAMFLWTVLSSLKWIISLSRYIINRPYVREIIVETEAERPKAPRQVKDKDRPDSPAGDDGAGQAPKKKKNVQPPVKDYGEDELPQYRMPSADILEDHSEAVHEVSKAEMASNIETIRTTLEDHKVQVADITAVPGPTVTLYKIYPARGVSVSSIIGKANDLSVALKVDGVRAEILKDSVGIEVPNSNPSMVPIKDLVTSEAFIDSDAELPVPIGYTVDKRIKVFDLTKTPHLLVAGATQQGKSVGLNVMVSSLLYAKRPSELQFVFIDPKGNEFNSYKHLYKHYLAVLPGADGEEAEKAGSVSVRPAEAEKVLRSLCAEMTERYDLMRLAGSTPNIKTYNEKYRAHKLNPQNGHRLLPYIVAVIDEYADLTISGSFTPDGRTTARNIMTSLILLASKGRAAGIHLIIATQTPRKDVISGVIKANFPTQIAFRVGNGIDSKVIIDCTGAEKLLGNGDMLFSQGARVERIQCGYIGPDEITALTKSIESQQGYRKSFSTPYYLPEVKDEDDTSGTAVDMKKTDERFVEAARFVVETQKASTSYLQTNLGLGFNRASRVMQQLEAAGIVGHQDGAKQREILVKDFDELDSILKSFGYK